MDVTPAQLEAIAPPWLKFYRAAAWGIEWKRPPVAERLDDPETYIHHTAGGRWGLDPLDAMRRFQTWFHDVKNYSTIAYDVMVHRNVADDTIAICGAREGALSAATRDRNELGEAVCLFGYFHPGHQLSEHPTDRELEALAYAVAWSIAHRWSALDTRVLGHRDNPAHPGATPCPGDYLDPHVPAIGRRALELLVIASTLTSWRPPMAHLHMLDTPRRLLDTRRTGGPVTVGESFTVTVDAPAGVAATAAVPTVTLVAADGQVHASLDASLGTSTVNTGPGANPVANTTLVNVRDGRIVGRIGGQPGAAVHVIVDLIAVIS